jgi:hypothetical protein
MSRFIQVGPLQTIENSRRMNSYRNRNMRDFLTSFSEEELELRRLVHRAKVDIEYSRFLLSLDEGKCHICQMKLNEFNAEEPCFHWFLNPDGIRKKHFDKYLTRPIGYHQLTGYLRWFAHLEGGFGAINDLETETSSNKMREVTIRYKNLEWAFAFSESDYNGHTGKKAGAYPHYHVQMTIDDRPFLGFNNYHIPFTEVDFQILEIQRQAPDAMNIRHRYGEGASILEDEEGFKLIDQEYSLKGDESNADYHCITTMIPPKGQKISGEMIRQAIEESNKTGRPYSNILAEMQPDLIVTKDVEAGSNVAEKKKRSGGK